MIRALAFCFHSVDESAFFGNGPPIQLSIICACDVEFVGINATGHQFFQNSPHSVRGSIVCACMLDTLVPRDKLQFSSLLGPARIRIEPVSLEMRDDLIVLGLSVAARGRSLPRPGRLPQATRQAQLKSSDVSLMRWVQRITSVGSF